MNDLIKIKKLCSSNERLPLELRMNKDESIIFLNIIKDNNIKINNKYITSLCEWCDFDLNKYKTEDIFSIVENKKYIGTKQTYDLEINQGSNFFANGMIVHNTTNLSKSITHLEVSELYKYAHEKGCKGLTIYVDGSRSGVLVSIDKTEEKGNNKLDRPKELICDIHHITANGIKYYVIIGLLNDKPYELFCFSKLHISIPPIKKEGKLIKIESGIYNLQYNGTTIENIATHFQSPEEDGFTRMISRMLRSNIPMSDICKDLDKSYSNISSFYKAISRTLRKNYITDEELNLTSSELCPECKSKLVYKDGCVSCISCSWSKCG